MPLQRGEIQGYDFNRMIVEFTMLNQGKVILCAISTTAMDDIEGKRTARSKLMRSARIAGASNTGSRPWGSRSTVGHTLKNAHRNS